MAAEEYHAEFAQKEATIARLTAEADTQKAQHQQKIDTLRTDMEVCLQVWPQCSCDGSLDWCQNTLTVHSHVSCLICLRRQRSTVNAQSACLSLTKWCVVRSLSLHVYYGDPDATEIMLQGYGDLHFLQHIDPRIAFMSPSISVSALGLGPATGLQLQTLCNLQGTVASVQQDMQQRLEEALAENKAQAESLREARERNMHFSARVVALNSRVAQLTKQVCCAYYCNTEAYAAAALCYPSDLPE